MLLACSLSDGKFCRQAYSFWDVTLGSQQWQEDCTPVCWQREGGHVCNQDGFTSTKEEGM